MLAPCLLLALATLSSVADAQTSNSSTPPNTFPHAYPGIPNTNANFNDSAAWQNCAQSRPCVFSRLAAHGVASR
jgi:carboxypeptidase D